MSKICPRLIICLLIPALVNAEGAAPVSTVIVVRHVQNNSIFDLQALAGRLRVARLIPDSLRVVGSDTVRQALNSLSRRTTQAGAMGNVRVKLMPIKVVREHG